MNKEKLRKVGKKELRKVPMPSDCCVVCGQNYVPEGRQVCPSCEARIYNKKKY